MPDFALLAAAPATVLAVEIAIRLRFASALSTFFLALSDSRALMRDTTLDDELKQVRMAAGSVRMLKATLLLGLIISLALAAYGLVLTAARPAGGLEAALLRIDLQTLSLTVAIAWTRVRVIAYS